MDLIDTPFFFFFMSSPIVWLLETKYVKNFLQCV